MTDHEPYPFCCPEHYPLRSMTGPKPTGAIISDHLLTEYERAEVAKAVRYLQEKHISFEGIKMFEEVAMSNTEIVREAEYGGASMDTIRFNSANGVKVMIFTDEEMNRYTGRLMRTVMTTDFRGHPISAVLQQRTGVDWATGHETWEDVRPLVITPDGKIILSTEEDGAP